jgi:hypothetical protein
MKAFSLLALLSLMPVLGYAQTKVGIMGTFLYNTTENSRIDSVADSQEASETSFGGGIRALVNITDRLILRTGAMLTNKNYTYEFTGPDNEGEHNFSFTYLSIPLTFYVPAGAQFGFFAGTALQAKLDSSCDGRYLTGATVTRCRVEKDRGLVLPAILGFDLALSEQLSMEVSYEFGLMETMRDTKVSSAVVSLIWNL